MKTLICCSVVALVTLLAAAPPNPAPREKSDCGQTEVGEVREPNSRGLKLMVVTSCEQKPRGCLFGWCPGLGGLNAKCDVSRKEIKFDTTADGTKYYERLGNVADRKCCDGEAAVMVRNLERVRQVCH